MERTLPASPATPARDVLPEDRLLWQFWVNKGLKPEPLAARLDALGSGANWDYVAGNALYGGFEADLLRLLRSAPARIASTMPPRFLDRLAQESAGWGRPVNPFTGEGRLLVLCSGSRMTPDEETTVRTLSSGGLHWPSLLAAASRANIVPAVAHHLNRLGLISAIPEPEAAALAARAAGIAGRNRRVLALLDEVVADLLKAGIRSILLKESALALSHFDGGALRMMGDVDILVDEPDLVRAERILQDRGYQHAEVLWTRAHYRRHHHHVAPLVDPEAAAKIEPHRTIALPVPEVPGLIDELRKSAIRIREGVHAFAPADCLFHLTMDLFGSAFLGKMGQLCDAREVVRKGGIDWRTYVETVTTIRAESHAAFSLTLLSDVGAAIPEEIRERLARARRKWPFDRQRLRRMAHRNLFGYDPSTAVMSRPATKLVFKALIQPGNTLSRSLWLIKGYLYVGQSDLDMGELAVRPSKGQALWRLAGSPFRLLGRILGGGRR